MKYRIVGDTMPAVEIMFDSVGESAVSYTHLTLPTKLEV